MTNTPHERTTSGANEQPQRLIVVDEHGRERPQVPAPEQGEVVDQDLTAARTAYAEAYRGPVIDGYVRSFLHGRNSQYGNDGTTRRDAYFDALTTAIESRLATGTEDHSDTTMRAVELAGSEWNTFNGELYEARRDQEEHTGLLRRFGGRALFAAEGGAAAIINHYTHFGMAEVALPAMVMGATAASTRFRPNVMTVDKIFPATKQRESIEQDTVAFLKELGLGDGATSGTIRREMERWLKRNKPTKLDRAENTTLYDAVKARHALLAGDSDIEEFSVRSAVELTFISLEQAQRQALENARSAENYKRLGWGLGGYAVFLAASLYFQGLHSNEEVHPDEHGPSLIEPSPTNSGPDDGISEVPLPSDVPSEGYFDDK